MTTPEKRKFRGVAMKREMQKEVLAVLRVVMQGCETTYDEEGLVDETKTIVPLRDLQASVREVMDMMFMDEMVMRKEIASGKPLVLHAFTKGEPISFRRTAHRSSQFAIKDLDGVTSEHATLVAAPAGTLPQWLEDEEVEEEGAKSVGEGEEEQKDMDQDELPKTPPREAAQYSQPSPKRDREEEGAETPSAGGEDMAIDAGLGPDTAEQPPLPAPTPTKQQKTAGE